MGEIRKKYDEDFKKNAVKLSYASPKPVRENGHVRRWRLHRLLFYLKAYKVTNKGKLCTVYLAKDEYYKNSDGFMENEILKTLTFSNYGETQTITVSSGSHIELTINATVVLTIK